MVPRHIEAPPWRRAGLRTAAVVVVIVLGISGCTGTSSTPQNPALPAHWSLFLHVPGVVDVTAPRTDRQPVVAAMGRLSILSPRHNLSPFAQGADGYVTAPGPEPYVALASTAAVAGAGCSFNQDDIYALEPNNRPGVVRVDGTGRAGRFADLPGGLLPDGIAFDDVGRFDHRLLVTATAQNETVLFALDCLGAVTTLTAHAPRMEGGIAVAPDSFGSFAGDLVAPDEQSGRIFAIDPAGHATTLAKSGLPSGGDIGVESAGFVPPAFGPSVVAYVADRRSPGNPHPGTDSILELSGTDLARASVHAGDLLMASEGGAQTIVVQCHASCTVRHIADGPRTTHAEGHITFLDDAA